jgi:hypothetical protein
MRADWLPINLSGRGWRFQRAACGAYAQMRGSARPDNALFQGKLASGWLINRRDNRVLMESVWYPRLPDHATHVETLSWMMTAPPSTRVYRRRAGTSIRKAGLWFSGENDARSNSDQDCVGLPSRSFCAQNGMRMVRSQA